MPRRKDYFVVLLVITALIDWPLEADELRAKQMDIPAFWVVKDLVTINVERLQPKLFKLQRSAQALQT